MVIAFVGSVIVFNALHPKKAEAPIEVIKVPPMVSDDVFVLPFNIFAGIALPGELPLIVILLAIF